MRIDSKNLLIIKRMISLNVDMNKIIIISLLNVSSDHFYDFKSNAFETITLEELPHLGILSVLKVNRL